MGRIKLKVGYCLYLFSLTVLFACSEEYPEEIKVELSKLPKEIDFNRDVKPVLADKCFACHGPDKGTIEASLQLHSPKTAFRAGDSGKEAIIPGKPMKSEVIRRILSDDPELVMPHPESNLTLSNYEKAVLIKWIDEGAEYKPHWAFIPPEKPKVPVNDQSSWPQNDIDQFILTALHQQGMTPNELSGKSLLLRRLSLDLTGLPPSLEELRSFEQDQSANAYEKQVDRLLASPHFGERLATDWMDLARFADTHGYTVDLYRDMSPWRTWVIKAFNKNMPYDQFVTWQLAGDLMKNATREQILATGFNRNHTQNGEGGIIDEEFRVEYVADRTSVTSQALMGMTMGCARCHDHKYDPISQKDFYEFYAFFNKLNESGQISFNPGDMPVPTLTLPSAKQEKMMAFIEKKLAEQDQALEQDRTAAKAAAKEWIADRAYSTLSVESFLSKAEGYFPFEGQLKNQNSDQIAIMAQQDIRNVTPKYVASKFSKAIQLDGDAWVDTKPVGMFRRNQPFSIGLWVNIPDSLNEGVVFHKNVGAKVYNYKGFHLYYRAHKLEMAIAHTLPDNAIERHTIQEIPRDEWIHLTMTYDGSSKAAGMKLYLNGKEIKTSVINDNLYKDIIYTSPASMRNISEPGVKIGARWRGYGLKDALIDEFFVFDRELSPFEILAIFNPQQADDMLKKLPDQLSPDQYKLLENYYVRNLSPEYQKQLLALQSVRTDYINVQEELKEVMVMKDMKNPRPTYILNRGIYNDYGEQVFPGVPERIFPMPEDYPKNRLGLAKWFFHPEHPLTARVAVNRYWQMLFGRGLVKTSEDFGNQGEMPSHPQLLDYLAIRFMESGWDVKQLLKYMVMSATYRQSTKTSEEKRQQDPGNVYYASGPQTRLTAEMLRDNALAVSGLLTDSIGGPSVKPYQPAGLWSINSGRYRQDSGPGLYRRSLYTLWKRTVTNPTLGTFDRPNRNECTIRRQKTNTPLQALVLLNDPTYVEAAKKIGEDMSRQNDIAAAIRTTFLELTGREAREEEMRILLELREKELKKFTKNEHKASGWLNTGDYMIQPGENKLVIAANAVVASVILNSDAAITKR